MAPPRPPMLPSSHLIYVGVAQGAAAAAPEGVHLSPLLRRQVARDTPCPTAVQQEAIHLAIAAYPCRQIAKERFGHFRGRCC